MPTFTPNDDSSGSASRTPTGNFPSPPPGSPYQSYPQGNNYPLAGQYPQPPQYPADPYGAPPGYHPTDQKTPANYPGQPLPPTSFPAYPGSSSWPGKTKKRRGLIIVLCVALVITLSTLGTLLYQAFNRDDSLAVGVKPAWDKPARVKLTAKGEPGLAYTLYSPEKDQLILLQAFKDGTGTAQMLDPKTGAKSGQPIPLPRCDNSLKYPYQLKGEKIVCATTDTVKANQNNKYHFKEQIYRDKRLVVGASPTASKARQIVAYSPQTTKLLWVQNLKKPASVTCNGKGVYTTRVVGDSSGQTSPDSDANTQSANPQDPEALEEGDSKELEVMALSGSSQAQDSPEEELRQADIQPSEPEIEKDAIKNIDFANAFQPFTGSPDCSQQGFWQKPDGTPVARKMPAATSECWATMENGASVEQFTPAPMNPESHMDAITLADKDVAKLFDSASFTPDPNKSYAVGYGDVNADGYLDALLVVDVFEGNGFNLAIFDPADPDHPYLTAIGPALENGVVKIVAPGRVNIYGSDPILGSDVSDLIAEMSIKGFEISDYHDSYSSL